MSDFHRSMLAAFITMGLGVLIVGAAIGGLVLWLLSVVM